MNGLESFKLHFHMLLFGDTDYDSGNMSCFSFSTMLNTHSPDLPTVFIKRTQKGENTKACSIWKLKYRFILTKFYWALKWNTNHVIYFQGHSNTKCKNIKPGVRGYAYQNSSTREVKTGETQVWSLYELQQVPGQLKLLRKTYMYAHIHMPCLSIYIHMYISKSTKLSSNVNSAHVLPCSPQQWVNTGYTAN